MSGPVSIRADRRVAYTVAGAANGVRLRADRQQGLLEVVERGSTIRTIEPPVVQVESSRLVRLRVLARKSQIETSVITGQTQANVVPLVEPFAVRSLFTVPCAVYESEPGYAAPADSDSISTASAMLGIARAINPSTMLCEVVTFGDMDWTGWGWTPQAAVYLGATPGALSQVPPATGYVVTMGYAVGGQRIRVAVGGESAGPEEFVFQQVAPATVWDVRHNLNRYPSVVLLDSSGDEIEADVERIDQNYIQVRLSAAVSGFVYLN